MNREEFDESLGDLSGMLNEALGMAQLLEDDSYEDKRFSKLREMIEESLDYCNDLYDSM